MMTTNTAEVLDPKTVSSLVNPDGTTNKLWVSAYPESVESELGSIGFNSLGEYAEHYMNQYEDRTAFISMKCEMSYGELNRSVEAFAAWLQDQGVKKGDRVALMMPNTLQYPVSLFAALRIGAVVVNVNPLYTAPELKHQLKDSGAETIVVLENFASTLQAALPGTEIKRIVLTQVGDLMSAGVLNLRGRLINFGIRKVKKMVPSYSLPNAVWMAEALAKGKRLKVVRPIIVHDDLAFLQYTGGTTGVSKGAMLTHGNLLANCQQTASFMEWQLDPDEIQTIVTPLPLYHIYSLTVNCLIFMRVGGRNILIANPRDIHGMVSALKGESFTALSGVNTLFAALLENKEFCSRDYSRLKMVCSGGMALQRGVAERWKAVTGVSIVDGWGLTECAPVVTASPVDIRYPVPAFTGSVGVPVPSTELRARRLDGSWCYINEPGELCVRGPQVMKGYWNRPEETAKSIDSEGWLSTGDVGVIEPNGYVRIVDRIKDMIIVSGFNVYPNEIEDVIALHPKVREVAAVGVPDEITGEKLKIFVMANDASLTAAELIAHCRTRLTAYKVPRIIEFRTEPLPKSPVGKILRRELR